MSTNPYQAPTTPPDPKTPLATAAGTPIPIWAWFFAVACMAVLAYTRGGAIPGAIAFSFAAGCIQIARSSATPLPCASQAVQD